MNVFIDESGKFRAPENISSQPNYECIIAIILSNDALIKFEEKFGEKSKLCLRLNARDVIKFIEENGCRAFAVIYDSNLSSKNTIEEHKKDYIRSIYKSSANHPFFLQETVKHHAEKLSKFSPNEYIKALLSIKLLENVLRAVIGNSTEFLKYDLKKFEFVCDSGNCNIESTIKYFSLFSMFCNSANNPICFDNRENIQHLIDPSGKYLDARLIFENINFVSSGDVAGVRAVDVVSNQLFRILHEESVDYDIERWKNIFSNPYSFDFLSFDKDQEFIDSEIGEKAFVFPKLLGKINNLV